MRSPISQCAIGDALLYVERSAGRAIRSTQDADLQTKCLHEVTEARKLRWTHSDTCAVCSSEEEAGRQAMAAYARTELKSQIGGKRDQ